MTMLNQLSRGALELGLRGARLPLTVAERVLGGGRGTSTWPPTALFDRVEAEVKEIVGRATRDDTLQAAARLQRSELDTRDNALAKHARAAQVERDAERRAEERRQELDAEREAIDASEAERQRQIDEAEREAQERAAREADAKRSATRTTAAKRAQGARKQATQAEAERLRAEAAALEAEEAAVAARGEALRLDKAVQAKKSARRSR